MDQSVTIDGPRVLLNGEPVAEALGDFSVRVLADAMMYVLLVQNDNSPEGRSIRQQIKKLYRLNKPGASLWCEPQRGGLPKFNVKTPMPAVNHQIPENVWRAMDAAAVAASVGEDGRHTLTGRIDVDLWPGDLSHLAPKREEMTEERFSELFSQRFGPEKTPAPADLIIKAREYYPDNEGLLRMYADCRGYSCDQVAEAIDHAKRL